LDRVARVPFVIVVVVVKGAAEAGDEWNIKNIQVSDLALSGIAVVMPSPARVDHKVSRARSATLAFYRRVATFSFEEKTACARRVPMCRRRLSGRQDLHVGEHRGGEIGVAAQTGIGENEPATFGFVDADKLCGFLQQVLQLGPGPNARLDTRARSVSAVIDLPVLQIVRPAYPLGEGSTLVVCFKCGHLVRSHFLKRWPMLPALCLFMFTFRHNLVYHRQTRGSTQRPSHRVP